MRIFFPFLFIVCLASCQQKAEKKVKNLAYFDLEGYFKKEAKRLSKENRPVDKTVWINGQSEQKIVAIKNWEKELEVFIAADINKGSWKGSFVISKDFNQATIYSSNSDKIPVKKLEVFEKDGKIKAIKIFIHNINDLYTSQDTLSYFPDSLYEIKKVQHIKLMEAKKYKIVGKF